VNATRGSDGLGDALEVLSVDDPTLAPSELVLPTLVERRRLTSTFSRLTTLHPAQLEQLPGWWTRHARDGRVRVTCRLTLEAPENGASDMWQMRGWLRRSRVGRRIRVDLQMWPVLGAWTKLTLEPQRRVHLGLRYFRTGHRALDDLTARLGRELLVDSQRPVGSVNDVRNASGSSWTQASNCRR
jgi:hypothetical protein